MIDNKERQEIVNNLRSSVELRENWENVPDGLLLDILAADLRYDRNKDFEPWLFTHLAELIEHPTCTIESIIFHDEYDEYEVELSCGHSITTTGFVEDLAFCQYCGAEVIK